MRDLCSTHGLGLFSSGSWFVLPIGDHEAPGASFHHFLGFLPFKLLFLVDRVRPAQCLNSGVIYDRSWVSEGKGIPLSRFLYLVSFLGQLFFGFYLRFTKLGLIRPGFRREVCGNTVFLCHHTMPAQLESKVPSLADV